MRTNLTIEDLPGFLDEPLVAVLATLRRDGSVQLSPVWHEWRDGGFNLWLPMEDVKTRHLRRDPRASLVVAESEIPLRGVELRTEATIATARAMQARIARVLTLPPFEIGLETLLSGSVRYGQPAFCVGGPSSPRCVRRHVDVRS